MSDQDNQTPAEEPAYLSMSDEDIMNMAEPDFGSAEELDFNTEEPQESEDPNDNFEGDLEEGEEFERENDDDDSEDLGSDDNDDAEITDEDDSQEDDDAEEDSEDDQEENSDEEEDDSGEKPADDAERFRKAILAPFKANGREVQVKDENEAVRLMQMGANYSKKMSGLKPVLKIARMLENNDLLDEGKLNYLIDLDKKNPDAIKKLLGDSEIDPMELENVGNDTEYTPTDHRVDDKEIVLSDVVEEMQHTPHYGTTVETVKSWDATSKEIAYKDPAILKAINDQVGSGVYDKINSAIENERMFGRLTDVPFLEAYRVVGNQLQASGALGSAPQKFEATETPAKQSKESNLKREKRKKAASTTKSKSSGKAKKDFNPLAMSDEEIMNLPDDLFM